MSEINRYWFGLYESCVMRSADGNWVRYEDHVKWADELENSHEAEIKLMRLLLDPAHEEVK